MIFFEGGGGEQNSSVPPGARYPRYATESIHTLVLSLNCLAEGLRLQKKMHSMNCTPAILIARTNMHWGHIFML